MNPSCPCFDICDATSIFVSKVPCYSRIPFAVVFIGSTLFALQQLSGINAVFYFSTAVFKRAGVPSTLANVFIGISNLTGVVFYFQIDLITIQVSAHFNLYLDLPVFFVFRLGYSSRFDG